MEHDSSLCAVILAAGEGKRMNSSLPKVLLEVLCKPMLGWVLDAVNSAGIDDICVVTGCKEEMVRDYLEPDIETVSQTERRGTGHAVMMARDYIARHAGGRVLIVAGDAPFITAETIHAALEQHISRGDSATVISAELEKPFGYGRIIRGADDEVLAIVEQKEGTPEQLAVREINSGAFWFDADALTQVLDENHLKPSAVTGEIYLTDAISALRALNCGVGACIAESGDIVLGANNPSQLDMLNEKARNSALDRVLVGGTRLLCRESVLIGNDVSIGFDTCILPGCVITGKTTIADNCRIGPNAIIDSCDIGSGCTIEMAQLKSCTLSPGVHVHSFEILSNASIDTRGKQRRNR